MKCQCEQRQCEMDALVCPVYETRPPKGVTEVMRLTDKGEWIPDDGEWGLAFYGRAKEGYTGVWGVMQHPDIAWKWCRDGNWERRESAHKDGNPWHYQLRDGVTRCYCQSLPLAHPNEAAHQKAIDACCNHYHCASGDRAEFTVGDGYIAAGLVRRRDTKEVIVFPKEIKCYKCTTLDVTGDVRLHKESK